MKPTTSSSARIGLLACALASLAGVGCHSQPPTSPEVGLTKPVDPPKPPDLGHGVARGLERDTYHMWMTENVRTVCKGPMPYFDFDSAETASSQQPTMQTLSTCMVEGPLKGKSIRLVGHTDPRGTENYNDKLGLERAERVKRYLVSHGVEPTRVVVESAGEDTASPAPSDWPKDRRVEIQLAK